jgi:hypothetical protein
VHLCLGKRHRYAQHPAMAGGGYADGDQYRAIDDLSRFANTLIASIQEDIGRLLERALPPRL